MPLAFVIARYFAYAFAAVAATWLFSFMALSVAINAGLVYEASWGPASVREVATRLSTEKDLGAEDVPTAYQYLFMGPDGSVRETDLDGTQLSRAQEAAAGALSGEPGDVEIAGGGSGLTYAAFRLADGGACALVSEYLPQWVSRETVATLPNPQNLMLAAGVAGSALALALVARRASRAIAQKMAPLVETAAHVGAGELNRAVARTNVREVNDVLDAMDAMRSSLAESLEARWQAERRQHEQVAALAHDLKTPLTVLRANADFVAEELGDDTSGEKDGELVAAARDIAAGAERLDGYVRLLIEASRGQDVPAKAPVQPAELCAQVVAEARPVARTRGVELAAEVDPSVTAALEAPLDRAALARAAANLVANACEHTRGRVELSCSIANEALVIEVADDGPGFSPAALEHGCERLFTDDSSRATRGSEQHYGLGLYTAAETARAHGGDVLLANRSAGGAVARITIPLRPAATTPLS